MALQVWLPLNGNLINKGLSNVSVTDSDTTIDDDGKIGKCCSFPSADAYLEIPNVITSSSTAFSVSFWIYAEQYSNGYVCAFCSRTEGTGKGVALFITSAKIRVDDGAIWNVDYEFQLNTWTHICVTWSLSRKTVYVNGEKLSTRTIIGDLSGLRNTLRIGNDEYIPTSYGLVGKLNDFRIYDTCLSDKEVREIAKGLLLHYKMDMTEFSPSNLNLVKNGWGGTDNWQYTDSSHVSTDVPSLQGLVTNSYINNNTTNEYIPLISDHSYTFSTYVKANPQTTGTTAYVTLIPYDVDKNRIQHWQQRDGFRASGLTTLAQDLTSGDRTIYLTDASGWANPATHEYFVAIFGYQDSLGYTYPDLVYTRRAYAYGSSTSKSNLDIANNSVTLLSAYTGETIPAGTSICLSSAGASYYYPRSISLSEISDWTLLTSTFKPSDVNYLKAAKYVQVSSIGDYQYMAGITLSDNTLGSEPIVYDCSGLGNNASVSGSLSSSNDTPRYNSSAVFEANGYIAVGRTTMVKDEITICCWAYMNNWSDYSSQRIFTCASAGGWGIVSSNGAICFAIDKGTSSNSYLYAYGPQLSNIASGWHYIVGTYNGYKPKIYVDGILVGEASELPTKTPIRYNSTNGVFIGAQAGSSQITPVSGTYFNGKMSDVRIYGTALTDSAVKELYDTSAYIINNGKVCSYEFIEEGSSPQIFKNGIFKCSGFTESNENEAAFYPTNIQNNELIEI